MAKIKTYGLYDGVSKEFIRTFTSVNDETAERACKYIVREPKFDEIQGKDIIIIHLYDFDTGSGKVENNDVRQICALSTFIAEYKSEKLMEKAVDKVEKAEEALKEVSEHA